jgi:hypothetical protein
MTVLAAWKRVPREERPPMRGLNATTLQTEINTVAARLGVEPRAMRGRTSRSGLREFRGRVPLNFPAEEFTHQLSLRLARYGSTVSAVEEGKQRTVRYEVLTAGKPAATIVLQRRPDIASPRKE